MNVVVHVRAPCRLHFGMFSFGRADRPQFGGVGAMIEPPAVDVRVAAADRFTVRGSMADRAWQIVELLASRWKLVASPACEVIVQSPPSHTGLGVGTQLSLALAAGLRRFLRLPEMSAEELAATTDRGMRSAVGTHGFKHGGLIVNAGKDPGQALGTLAERIALPEAWRFVLFCRAGDEGLAGSNEAAAFGRLPPVPDDTTRELWTITKEQMLPAVERRDCDAFGDAVYRFGRLAGECFSAAQGGPFANTEIARLVELIREFGVPGVGQSSWGPTVFAITANEEEAQQLVDWIGRQGYGEGYEMTVARPNNTGALVETM